MVNSKQIRAAWINAGTSIQHGGIGSFGKWDGVLILYHGLITAPVYCTAKPKKECKLHLVTTLNSFYHGMNVFYSFVPLSFMHTCSRKSIVFNLFSVPPNTYHKTTIY